MKLQIFSDMKSIIKIIMMVYFLSISFSTIAQKSKLYLESNQTYSKGKIYIKKSLIPISATTLTLLNDTLLSYTDSATGSLKSLNIFKSNVNYIKIRTGTRAGGFALYGGALMGLSAILAVLETERDYGTGSTSDFAWEFIGGFTAGGFIIGGLIGVFIPKYKNFYIKNKQTAYNIKLNSFLNKGEAIGLGMHITF